MLLSLFISCTEIDNNNSLDSNSYQKIKMTSEELLAIKIANEGTVISQSEAIKKAYAYLNEPTTKISSNMDCDILWIKLSNNQVNTRSQDVSVSDSVPLYLIKDGSGNSVLISGDERLPEMLAHSKDNISIEKRGTGLDVFLEALPIYINDKIIEFNARYDSLLSVAQRKINTLNGNLSTKSSPTAFQRIVTESTNWSNVYSYGPFVSVRWGQGYPYNTALDKINCEGSNITPFLGCAAVAVSQLLTYHKYPSSIGGYSINWNEATRLASASNLSSTYQMQIANVMKSVAIGVHTSFGCSGSGVSMSDISPYLSTLGYLSDGFQSYNNSLIVSSLKNNRPLIITAFTPSQDGHGWVLDGAKKQERTVTHKIYQYNGNGIPRDPIVASEWTLIDTEYGKEYAVYVHCNYGWEGDCDGYYIDGVFNVRQQYGKEYSFDRKINIIPNIRH